MGMQTQLEMIRLQMEARARATNDHLMATQGYFNTTWGMTYWLVYQPPVQEPLPHQENQLIPLQFKQI